MADEWNLSPFERTKEIYEKERVKAKNAFENFSSKWKNRKDYLEKPEILAEALVEYNELERKFGEQNEGCFYWLRSRQDVNDPEVKAGFNSFLEFQRDLYNQVRFFDLEVSKIKKELQNKFLSYSGLQKFKNYLQKGFNESEYLLSEEVEKALSVTSQSGHSDWLKLNEKLLTNQKREVILGNGEIVDKNYEELLGLMQNPDSNIRKNAAKAFNSILEKNLDVSEAEINSILRRKKEIDKLRGMSRPDLGRHLDDNIETEIVDTLIKTVTERFSISKRYYALKSKLFGVDKINYYERAADYGKLDAEFSYEKSKNLVEKVLSNIDLEFGNIFKKFVDNGAIDVFPKNGKEGGAFCVYFGKDQPVYIMLNHTNTLTDVTTLAHEVGHGINDELMRKQNALNYSTPLATAEVASTFMEDFVLEELLKEATQEEKLTIMMQKLDGDIASIQRQIACYNFETNLHKEFREKGDLPKERIGEMFKEEMGAYMGNSVNLEGADNWWSYWSHIRNFFYVYSYSSGILISKAMQQKVKEDPKFINNVKDFLSAGESKSPKELFLDMGIDVTKKEFWNKGLDKVENLLDETESLAKKLGKI